MIMDWRLRAAGGLALVCILLAGPATAADIAATSRIEAVTVFPSGAEVTRVARVKLEPGEHTLLFNDFPGQAIATSIRVEGKATGRLELGSIDSRRIQVPRGDPLAVANERRAVENEIERLKDVRALIEGEARAAEAQKAMIAKLTELPLHPSPAGPGGVTQAPDWPTLLNLVGTRHAEAEKALQQTRVRLRETTRSIEDLEKKLATLAPTQETRTEVKVFVAAGAALEADLTLRYQVPNASWVPLYDARLSTGGRGEKPVLTLTRRASIQQRTGEDWTEVALALSTTRPGSGTAAPELSPMTVDFEPERPPAPKVSAMPAPMPSGAGQEMRRFSDRDATSRTARMEAPAAPVPVAERQATVEAAPFQAIFVVPGRTTVLRTGERKRVQLDEARLEPALVVRATPRLEGKAFLYAKLSIPRTTPYLPGQVSLFRDATFVGNGHLPLLSPGEEHELGFGADDNVRVKHALVEEKRGEAGIISSAKTDTRTYKITVKSLHATPIQVSVMDQVPVSQHQDIKVELTARQPPTRRDVDDRRGVMAWDFKLEPDEERVIDFGYRVSWPASKKVQYGR